MFSPRSLSSCLILFCEMNMTIKRACQRPYESMDIVKGTRHEGGRKGVETTTRTKGNEQKMAREREKLDLPRA
jgi:hypothetical protein